MPSVAAGSGGAGGGASNTCSARSSSSSSWRIVVRPDLPGRPNVRLGTHRESISASRARSASRVAVGIPAGLPSAPERSTSSSDRGLPSSKSESKSRALDVQSHCEIPSRIGDLKLTLHIIDDPGRSPAQLLLDGEAGALELGCGRSHWGVSFRGSPKINRSRSASVAIDRMLASVDGDLNNCCGRS